MSIRLKRILAFLIDWNLVCLPVACAASLLLMLKEASQMLLALLFLGAFLGALLMFAVIVLRDWLLRGRSLGKRIFGLFVYDQKTLQKASPSQLALRNVFFFIYFVEGILLLFTGRTVGDRVANTVVLTENQVEAYKTEQAHPVEKKQKKAKRWIWIVAIVVACGLVFSGAVQAGLAGKKNAPGYETAHQYLVESDAFEMLNAEASEIRLKHYYEITFSENKDDPWRRTLSLGFGENFTGDLSCSLMEETNQTVQFAFGVGLRTFRVVCHNEAGTLQVCDHCTHFH